MTEKERVMVGKDGVDVGKRRPFRNGQEDKTRDEGNQNIRCVWVRRDKKKKKMAEINSA